jgi:alanine dehydrogenase
VAEGALWLGERDIAELLTLAEAIDVLEDAYRRKAAGEAASMRRAHLREGQSILHAVGGSLAAGGVAGTKTWTYTPGGARPLLILFSLHDGAVLGIIEAFAMGQLRTAATSGLGTRVLAAPDASTLALLGTGRQARAQAEAVAAVRPIREVRVFGRDPERRERLADELRSELDVAVSEHREVASAVTGAAVVTAVTRAAEPILDGDDIAAGTHLNAVGAIVPTRRELAVSAVARCDVVVADSVEQAREDAGELRAAVDAGALDWEKVRGLEEVLDVPVAALRTPSQITLFKALGVGLADVALGAELLSRAHARSCGIPLPMLAAPHH